MNSGRRGQFYSVIAILIIIPITIFVTQYLLSQTRGPEIFERVISDQVHQAERNIEKDFERALVTSGKRAIIGLSDKIILNGSDYNDSAMSLMEMMDNGTLYGNESMIMVNNTISNWTTKILSIPVNFIVSMNHSNLSVVNYDGFHIRASVNFNISVSDNNGIAKMERVNVYNYADISLESMEDPLFPLNTNGLITRSIKMSPYDYRAKKIVTGTFSEGYCSGEVTFDKMDCNSKILVADNASGVSFGCFDGMVIGDSVNLSGSINCFVSGNSSALEMINSTISSTGYGDIYIDNKTVSAWHLPLRDELDEGYYIEGNGPDYLKRLEGDLSPSQNSLETFINARDLETYSIPIKENQVSLCYLYFSEQDYIGYTVRGLQSWFKINQTMATKYGLTELYEG
ncbi:MAG: hypothetical protein JW754_00110 [Candidatus Aenigmarchaeota archaeon]|nr:hypothetical protein [Candidatus Aenigmarchaeota archaeon]